MRRCIPLMVFLVLTLLATTSAAAEREFDAEIQIVAGHQMVYDSKIPIGGISNSNPRAVRDVVDRKNNQIIFFGTAPGEMTYVIFDRHNARRRYTILVRVVDKDLGRAADELRSLFQERGLDGISVRVAGRGVLVEGSVTLPKDLVLVNKILKRYPEAVNLVGIDKATLETLVEDIEHEIDRPTVQVRLLGNTVVLEGWVTSQAEKDRAEEIAEAILGGMDSRLEVR